MCGIGQNQVHVLISSGLRKEFSENQVQTCCIPSPYPCILWLPMLHMQLISPWDKDTSHKCLLETLPSNPCSPPPPPKKKDLLHKHLGGDWSTKLWEGGTHGWCFHPTLHATIIMSAAGIAFYGEAGADLLPPATASPSNEQRAVWEPRQLVVGGKTTVWEFLPQLMLGLQKLLCHDNCCDRCWWWMDVQKYVIRGRGHYKSVFPISFWPARIYILDAVATAHHIFEVTYKIERKVSKSNVSSPCSWIIVLYIWIKNWIKSVFF